MEINQKRIRKDGRFGGHNSYGKPEYIEKQRIARLGEKHWNWKGGKRSTYYRRLKLSYKLNGGKPKKGGFQKGNIPSNKGKHHTEETKIKLSQVNIGKKLPEEIKKKISISLKGHKLSEETKRKIGLKHKGKIISEEVREKLREARKLQIFPIKDSKIEVKIQSFLKELGLEFFTHQYMKGIQHGYQCDVLIPSMNLVIECDGIYWHKYPIGREIDHIRTKELLEKGFRVLRLWENEIKGMTIEEFNERLNKVKIIGGNMKWQKISGHQVE